jgi:hypothetical protein
MKKTRIRAITIAFTVAIIAAWCADIHLTFWENVYFVH